MEKSVMKKSIGKSLIAIVLVLAMAIAVVALVGCDNKKSPTTLPNIPELTDTRPETADTVTYTTINNKTVTYNKNTRKIVALSGAGDLAAFGIHPTAVMDESGISERYPSLFPNVSVLENTQPFDAEEIASYAPELILVYQNMEADNIATLSAIAPVIPLLREENDYSIRLNQIGEIFGLEESAAKLIEYSTTIKANAAKIVEELGLKGKSATLFMDMMGSLTIPPDFGFSFNDMLYEEFGMTQPEAVKAFLDGVDTLYTPISAEKVRDFEGDAVILCSMDGELVIPDTLKANPGWLSLKAVQNDKVGIIDALLYAEKDILLLEDQYSQMIDALKKTL